MKKSLIFVSVVAMTMLMSCGTAVQPEQVAVTPKQMAVVGNKINTEITGTFPVKKFSKNAVLTITPVLVYEGGEAVGQSYTFVGEKAKENGTTVSFKEGASFTMKSSFDYVPQMDINSKLELRFTATKGKKTVQLPPMVIAEGVNATSMLAAAEDVKVQVTADKFQRIIQEVQEADIHFLIQQTALRNSE